MRRVEKATVQLALDDGNEGCRPAAETVDGARCLDRHRLVLVQAIVKLHHIRSPLIFLKELQDVVPADSVGLVKRLWARKRGKPHRPPEAADKLECVRDS